VELLGKGFVSDYSQIPFFPKRILFLRTVLILRRAAISYPSNIAEGSSRISQKDQGHFSQLAYGSLMEVACQLNIAKELGFIKKEEYKKFTE